MKIAGIVLLILGGIGTLIFGIQAIQETDNFCFLGIDIGVSGANWTPVIISAVILVAGIIMTVSAKKTATN